MARRVRTTPRKKPRQDRSRATVDAILEAAAQVLVEVGYDRTSTNRVARRAGVSIGSLYQYFPNKEALVGELVDRYSAEMTGLVVEELQRLADAPPPQAARALVTRMVDAKQARPLLSKVLREQVPRVGRMQRYEQNLERLVEATARYMTRWAVDIRQRDIETAALLAVLAVDACTHIGLTRKPPLPREVLIDHTTDLVSSYLMARTTTTTTAPPVGIDPAASPATLSVG